MELSGLRRAQNWMALIRSAFHRFGGHAMDVGLRRLVHPVAELDDHGQHQERDDDQGDQDASPFAMLRSRFFMIGCAPAHDGERLRAPLGNCSVKTTIFTAAVSLLKSGVCAVGTKRFFTMTVSWALSPAAGAQDVMGWPSVRPPGNKLSQERPSVADIL